MSDPVASSAPSQDSNDLPAPIFYSDFDFEDGNIIISATGRLPTKPWQKKSKVVTRYFRVHKSILKLHSTTFADLFSVPQPGPTSGEDQETIGGVAVVHLHDELLDLIKLMTVMYYGDTVPQTALYQETFDFLAPVVQLADKYGMEKVVDKYLPRIKGDWPVSLEKWDHNEGQIKLFATYQQTLSNPEPPDAYFIEPCCAIRFARKQGIDSILPSAFYHLSRISPLYDFEGDDSYDYTFYGGRTANWSLLSSQDYRRLLKGQNAIRSWVLHQANRWSSSYRILHSGEATCRKDWWDEAFRPRFVEILLNDEVDVLEGLARMVEARLDTTGLCTMCHEKAYDLPKRLREGFWDKLPEFFGLEVEDWGDEDEPMH